MSHSQTRPELPLHLLDAECGSAARAAAVDALLADPAQARAWRLALALQAPAAQLAQAVAAPQRARRPVWLAVPAAAAAALVLVLGLPQRSEVSSQTPAQLAAVAPADDLLSGSFEPTAEPGFRGGFE